jgi:hypothetical protein
MAAPNTTQRNRELHRVFSQVNKTRDNVDYPPPVTITLLSEQ